jgi:hypothetical protein
MQSGVTIATNPTGIHHVIPELRKVTTKPVSLELQLLEQPSLRDYTRAKMVGQQRN